MLCYFCIIWFDLLCTPIVFASKPEIINTCWSQGEVCEWLKVNTYMFVLTEVIWCIILSTCCLVSKLCRGPRKWSCCNCDKVCLCILCTVFAFYGESSFFLYLHAVVGFSSASINLCWILLQILCNKTRFIFQDTDISLNFHETFMVKYRYLFRCKL